MYIFLNNEKIEINISKLQKTFFIYNSIENGWNVEKKNDCYIFSKKHNNDKKILLDSYLKGFVMSNLDIKGFFK